MRLGSGVEVCWCDRVVVWMSACARAHVRLGGGVGVCWCWCSGVVDIGCESGRVCRGF